MVNRNVWLPLEGVEDLWQRGVLARGMGRDTLGGVKAVAARNT